MESGSVSSTGGQREEGKPRLVSLTVHELPGRNIDPCSLRFSDGFNVLLGLNATGKTTLLEIITAALSFNFSKFKDEVFSVEYELQFPQGLIQAKVRNARPAQPHPLMIRGRQGSESLEYSANLHVRSESPSLEWDIQANASALRVQAVSGSSMTAPFPTASLFRSDFLLLALHLMTGTSPLSFNPIPIFTSAVLSWSVLQRFDESLGFFNAITEDAAWLEATRPHGSTSEPNLADVGLVPGHLCDEIIRQCAHRAFGDEGDSLSISHQHIGFLAKAAEILDFKAIRAEVRLQQRKTDGAQDRLRLGDLRFTFERHDGSIITHKELSYGQKRLLALFYYLALHPDTVVADELVDGLHHRWISDCIEVIGDRQAFLASQNPLILDHMEFASADQVASTFILCRSERRDDREHLGWSNMSAYDAERFFRAYQVDVQHVSEILLSKGLW